VPRKRGEIQPGVMKVAESSSEEEEEPSPKVDHGKCTWLNCAFPTTPTDVKCTECAAAFHSFHRDGTPKCALHYSSKRAGRPSGNREKEQEDKEKREGRLGKEKAKAADIAKVREDAEKVTHYDIIPSTMFRD